MATRKKAKAKRKKTTIRRKVAKVVKKVVKKAVKKLARKAPVRRKPKAVPRKAMPPAPPPPPGDRIGVVTHYYGNVSVAIIKLEPGITLRVGDNIHIRGHTSDFGQRVESLQIGHAPVSEVGPDDDFGLKVAQHAREHDVVYRLK